MNVNELEQKTLDIIVQQERIVREASAKALRACRDFFDKAEFENEDDKYEYAFSFDFDDNLSVTYDRMNETWINSNY